MLLRALSTLIFTAFLGCAGTAQPPTQPQTVRPLNMQPDQFVTAANKILFQKTPEWYAPATHTLNILMTYAYKGRYASVSPNPDGSFTVSLERPALTLSVIEDMAHVLLHEYVHIKIWDNLYAMDMSEKCHLYRGEMIANMVVVEHYHEIGYRRSLLVHAIALYVENRMKAKIHCPEKAYFDLPVRPVPIVKKQRSYIPEELTPQEVLELDINRYDQRIQDSPLPDRYKPQR